jgi:hypothetical protein
MHQSLSSGFAQMSSRTPDPQFLVPLGEALKPNIADRYSAGNI